jgi:DNA-binding NtrC family response regulator
MQGSDFRLLLVEDEEHMVNSMRLILEPKYSLEFACSIEEALRKMKSNPPDLLLLDLHLTDGLGIQVLREARKMDPGPDVVVITGSQDVGMAVEVMKLGAQDYLQKPFAQEDLLLCIQRVLEKWELKSEVTRLRSELLEGCHWGNIIGQSPVLMRALNLARKMSLSDTTVLITGESGTGKDLVARAIHCEGLRSNGPFVAVNCAQFSGPLLESELFGHEKGAFTGATTQRRGRFELADGGTLFLDEIGSTSLEMQVRILRAVETRQFERVGGEKTISSDFRLIAATNADLEEAMKKGEFREDLYYRLNVVRIEVPPLRDRREDIPQLCEHFLTRLRGKSRNKPKTISPEAMAMLSSWNWPGNIRELGNVLEMAYALEESDFITSRCLPLRMRMVIGEKAPLVRDDSSNLLEAMVSDYERQVIEEHLSAHGWNQLKTARSLGIHRNTIDKKIKKYGLSRPRAMHS